MVGRAAERLRADWLAARAVADDPESTDRHALTAAIGLLACALAPDATALETCGRLIRDLAGASHGPSRSALLLALTAARHACAASDEAQRALAAAFQAADQAAAEAPRGARDEALERGTGELLRAAAAWLDQSLSLTAGASAAAPTVAQALEQGSRALARSLGAVSGAVPEGARAAAVEWCLRAAVAAGQES